MATFKGALLRLLTAFLLCAVAAAGFAFFEYEAASAHMFHAVSPFSISRFWKETAGRVVRCDNRFPFSDDYHPEIVAYGLEDPRGLAWDEIRQRVLIAGGGRQALEMYSVKNHIMVPPEGLSGLTCPDAPCQETDQRGIAIWHDALIAADYQRSRISKRDLGSPRASASILGSAFTGPSGVAIDEDQKQLMVTDDRPWPGEGSIPSDFDATDYRRWLEENRSRPFGGLYIMDIDRPARSAERIDSRLRHPSGVAFTQGSGTRLYVTEADEREIRWLIYTRANNRWERTGVLAAEKNSEGTIPAFQGIAVASAKGWYRVFAAGPGGLYIFEPDGTGLGRIEFDGRVTGLVWGSDGEGKRCLYVAAGHTLCRFSAYWDD